MIDDFIHEPRVAYFSMEIALANDIPTYSGGLGVLAGDTVRTAVDLTLPMVAVTLVSRMGHFRQEIDADGRQIEHPDPWEPAAVATRLDAMVAVTIEGRQVWIGGWFYELTAYKEGSRQPVILLDTDIDQNNAEDRQLTHYLYGGDNAYRFKQEMVLGIGGMLMLQALGFEIYQYHMNEGHSALLAVELLRRYAFPPEDLRPGDSPYDVPRIREICNFTTHTPVEAGQDRFPYDLVQRLLGDIVDAATLRRLGGDDAFNMTRVALNLSEYVNGVAKAHAQVSRSMFPGYVVHAITNGVHPRTWTCAGFAALYERHLPGWYHEPELLMRVECCVAKDEIWQAHMQAKRALAARVAQTGVTLDVDLPTIGFARRMTAYKRADLLFSDLERLAALAERHPFQIVLAGKAHPHDEGGKQLIELLHKHMRDLRGRIAIAYLPDYDMDIALAMVSGVDLWLNTPLRPMEASGTSGMKAAFNGVPSLSVLDGWWVEGCIEGITGWAIGDSSTSANGDDALALYDKLEHAVLPLYHDDRNGWITVMQGAISKNAALFNSHRMMRRYATEAYLR
jgi:glycogen phosphorylase